MFKNVASQKIELVAYDYTTGQLKSGDAANITAYVAKDYGAATVLGDTSATESDATNAKGVYLFDLTQAETNADNLLFTAKSSTANVQIVPKWVVTLPNRFTTLVIDAAGLADANMVKAGPTGAGTAQTARDLGAGVITPLMKRQNTAQTGSATSITLDASATTEDCERGDMIYILSGTGIGGSNIVETYDTATKVATMVQNWVTNPNSSSVFQVWKVGGIVPVVAQLSPTGKPQVDVMEVLDIVLQTSGSGTQDIGGP